MFIFQKKLFSKYCVVVSDALVLAHSGGTLGEKEDSEIMAVTFYVD